MPTYKIGKTRFYVANPLSMGMRFVKGVATFFQFVWVFVSIILVDFILRRDYYEIDAIDGECFVKAGAVVKIEKDPHRPHRKKIYDVNNAEFVVLHVYHLQKDKECVWGLIRLGKSQSHARS